MLAPGDPSSGGGGWDIAYCNQQRHPVSILAVNISRLLRGCIVNNLETLLKFWLRVIIMLCILELLSRQMLSFTSTVCIQTVQWSSAFTKKRAQGPKYCTVLYCTVLYCPVLSCPVLYCTVLHCGPRGCSRRSQLYEHFFCMFWASN